MSFFEWKKSFNVGVEEIDRQHKEFLECLNECYYLNDVAKDAPVSRYIIGKLKNYAEIHFAYEEELFQEIGYPEIESHLKQHEFFASHVRELENELVDGDIERTNSVLCFLRDWFLNHILEADMKYAPFVKASRKGR